MNESNNFEEDDQLEQKANSESIVVVTTYPRYFNNRETGFGSQIAERNNNNQVSTGFNQSVLEQNIDTHSPQSFSPIGTGRVGYGTDYLNNKAMPKTQQERVQSQNFAGNLLTYRGYNSSTGENISEYRKTFKNSLNNQSHNSTVDVVVTDDSLIDNEDKLIDLDRTQERTLERQVESNIFDNQLDGTPRSSMDSKTPRPNNIALQLAREIAQQNQTESLGLASNQVRKILDPKRAKMVKKFLKIKREQDQYLFTGPNVTLFMFSQMCSVAFFFLPVDGPRLLAPFIILVFIFMGISYAQTYLYLSMRQDHPFALFTQDVAFGEGYGRASIVYISLIQLFQYIFNPFFLLYMTRDCLFGISFYFWGFCPINMEDDDSFTISKTGIVFNFTIAFVFCFPLTLWVYRIRMGKIAAKITTAVITLLGVLIFGTFIAKRVFQWQVYTVDNQNNYCLTNDRILYSQQTRASLMVVCLTYMIPQLNYLLNNYSMYILPIHQRLAKDDPEGRHGRSMLNRAITATGVFYILIYTAVCLNHQKRGDGAELIIAVLLNDSSVMAPALMFFVGTLAILQIPYNLQFAVEQLLIIKRELKHKAFSSRIERMETLRFLGKDSFGVLTQTGESKAMFSFALQETSFKHKALLYFFILVINAVAASLINKAWIFLPAMGSISTPILAQIIPSQLYLSMRRRNGSQNEIDNKTQKPRGDKESEEEKLSWGVRLTKYFQVFGGFNFIFLVAISIYSWHIRQYTTEV